MMPKGVEHIGGSAIVPSSSFVRIPMMPKGVEHKFQRLDGKQSPQVRIPMMPKGVEHVPRASRGLMELPRENSDDAERR